MTLNTELLSHGIYSILVKAGVSEDISEHVNLIILLLFFILLVYALQYIVRFILRVILIRIGKKTNYDFFVNLLHNRFPHYLAYTIPLVLIKEAIPLIFVDFKYFISPLYLLTDICTILIIIWTFMAVLRSASDSLKKRPAFRDKPMESYLQIIQIILFLFAAVMIFSTITGKSPVVFFTAMGAASAVLLLMFKDTIMGFVASIQVTTNDMMRIGDWITMSKYGADGTVIEINLTTVKTQNFDKTITTIPTYALISDSFQNWRGMFENGGRRIKRAIFIKQSTIRFISDEEAAEYKKIQSLASYIEHRQRDIIRYNERIGADKSLLINGRNLTNAGLYRKYIENYISNHTGTHQSMIMMVRHLAPTAQGLPLEIYVFSKTTTWIEYEHIMADIFDHLLAAARYFDLEIFESVSGTVNANFPLSSN